jgi:1-acyl-sn-glycerol-3-phosphate acyltransferase
MTAVPLHNHRHTLSWYWFQARLVGAFAFFGLLCLFFLATWTCSGIFFRSNTRRKTYSRAWVRFGFRSLLVYLESTRLIKITFSDERTDKDAPVRLIVANHVSFIDVVILVAKYPWAFSLVKKSMANHPLLHTIITNSGFIPIDPQNPEARMDAFNRITEAIKAGETGIIFPEGTRTTTGQLGEFNKGAFKALMMTSTDLTPIVISISTPFLGKSSIFENCGRKVDYRLTIFDNIKTPVPDIPKPRDLAEFRVGAWNFFANRLNRQYASEWLRMKNTLVHNGMVIEIQEETAQHLRAQCLVEERYPHFRGHFDTFPILPAVSQIDLVRSVTAAILKRDIRVKRVRRSKFLGPIRPGERVNIAVKLLENTSDVEWSLKGVNSEFSRGILSYEG